MPRASGRAWLALAPAGVITGVCRPEAMRQSAHLGIVAPVPPSAPTARLLASLGSGTELGGAFGRCAASVLVGLALELPADGDDPRIPVDVRPFQSKHLALAGAQGTIDSHGDSISYEFLAQTNPSWLVVIDRDAAIGAEGESAQQLLNNDLVNATAAATSGRIAYVVPEYWYLAFGGLTATSAVYAEVAALVE